MTPEIKPLQTGPGRAYVLSRQGGEPRNVRTPLQTERNRTATAEKEEQNTRSAARGKVGGATSGFWSSDITGSGLSSSGLRAATAGECEGNNDFPV